MIEESNTCRPSIDFKDEKIVEIKESCMPLDFKSKVTWNAPNYALFLPIGFIIRFNPLFKRELSPVEHESSKTVYMED